LPGILNWNVMRIARFNSCFEERLHQH
jgi:hypothetical protein